MPVRAANRVGRPAAVEWWACWTEQGQELTYAGVSVLRFDSQGQVAEHRAMTTTSSNASGHTPIGEEFSGGRVTK